MRWVACLVLMVMLFPRQAWADFPKITEVKGVPASQVWLLEDHTLPIVAMRIAFRHAGSAYDGADKQGLAYVVSNLLGKGAGDLDNLAFKTWLEELAISIEYSVDKDYFYIALQTLSEHKEKALQLLALTLTQPRFDTQEVERVREQLLVSLAQRREQPRYIASLHWNKHVFGKHPYSYAVHGTEDTLQHITKEDIQAFKNQHLVRDAMLVSVVGDITEAETTYLIGKYFDTIPAKSSRPITFLPVFNQFPESKYVHIKKSIPQSLAVFGHKGIDYHDPDFYPAYIVDYVLGGGGFESRLMKEVREKRGLAYSIYTYINPLQYTTLYKGSVGTRNQAINASLDIIKAEMDDIRTHGITAEELSMAKSYLLGSFALKMDSNAKLASYLTFMQTEELGIDFLQRRNAMVAKVTLEDTKRVAKNLLDPEHLTIVVVGDHVEPDDDATLSQ